MFTVEYDATSDTYTVMKNGKWHCGGFETPAEASEYINMIENK
mgnify:CR=1 FL=1